MESIQFYKPLNSSVTQARVLLIGPVGAGKSSFFNSFNSVFRGHVTGQAMAGSTSTSLTTQPGSKMAPVCLARLTGFSHSNSRTCWYQFLSSICMAGCDSAHSPVDPLV
ncbi:Interferon-induced protein 44-like [Oryzias melastigma]|uniref:Interferon-induced protein 44-like n=1 Tax=Oryzias melastigma TaxID=30732 RepID=A0A834FHM5_ORYME|nr:Interferon-induced protein 44-like [Oryzias melastigma]